jgi:hypothetical protein
LNIRELRIEGEEGSDRVIFHPKNNCFLAQFLFKILFHIYKTRGCSAANKLNTEAQGCAQTNYGMQLDIF